MKHVPLHELEREVLNMPVVPAPPYETGLMMDGKGNIVENPDYRRVTGVAGTDRMYYEQPTATVEIKHDLSVKWYGAQFHRAYSHGMPNCVIVALNAMACRPPVPKSWRRFKRKSKPHERA